VTEYKVYDFKEMLGWFFVYSDGPDIYGDPSLNGFIVDANDDINVIMYVGIWKKTEITITDEAKMLGKVLRSVDLPRRDVKFLNEAQWEALRHHLEHVKKWKEYPEKPLTKLITHKITRGPSEGF